ncbi:hypothetical protein KIW84_011040 [Lathyrus oleraceus]|uniref:Uncharacterized protein n=1 Tax=Pisum sativum TaxID=3888 RepID=A0A9D4YNH8_PEA|nr:hypothetical protein KIW84_011040 [Pisum sativum]
MTEGDVLGEAVAAAEGAERQGEEEEANASPDDGTNDDADSDRDVNFDESKFWPWSDDNIEQKVQVDFDGEGEKNEQPSQITSTDSPNSDVSADCEIEETKRRTQRNRRRPTWMSDFEGYEEIGFDDGNGSITVEMSLGKEKQKEQARLVDATKFYRDLVLGKEVVNHTEGKVIQCWQHVVRSHSKGKRVEGSEHSSGQSKKHKRQSHASCESEASGAGCKIFGRVKETTMHALRDLPRAMQLWLNKVPENIKLDFFSLELAKWIDLNLTMSSKWTIYWEVDCHSLWMWRNKEMHDDNYERSLFSRIHVQCRTDKYDEAMKNN